MPEFDFDQCVEENQDKSDPDAYCAVIMRQIEGKAREFDILADDRISKVVETDGIALAEDIRTAMRAAGQKTAVAAGQQAPVRPAPVEPAKADSLDLPGLDPDNPPEEFADALEAEDFILYGKASIEQFDRGGEKDDTPEILDMDAIEAALDRFFESKKAPGIVSLTHDDIPVGRPLREYTLDEPATIEVGGDVYEFDAGETLATHVEDGDGDGRPELWGLSDLANDTRLSRRVRLAALLGELDGYSITFGRHPESVTPEGPGRRVGSLDLFSWTLAPAEFVANPGSEFDVAAFKAWFDADSADRAARRIREAVDDVVN